MDIVFLGNSTLLEGVLRANHEDTIGRLEVFEDEAWRPCGTGFYVRPDLVVTAWHTIAGEDLSLEPAKTSYRLVTQQGPSDLRLAYDRRGNGLYDPIADWAALATPARDSQRVLKLGRLGPPRSAWRGFGYPVERDGNGLLISGHIEGTVSDDKGQPMVQLYGYQLSGSDPKMRGFSGSPCLQDDQAVAIMRFTASYLADRVALATLFATPIPSRLFEYLGWSDGNGTAEVSREAREALEALFNVIFTIDELRHFIESGPRGREVRDALPIESGGLTARQFRTQIVEILAREGLVTPDWWDRLIQRRPHRRQEILAVRYLWTRGPNAEQ